jgi:hypothetical protein
VPSRKLQRCDSKDQLCQLSNCLGIPRAKPPARQRFQKPSLSSGLPNAEPSPARVVPAYPRTRDLCFIDSPFLRDAFSRRRIAGWLSYARDEGLPVELSIVRLHVSDGSGRKYTSFHASRRRDAESTRTGKTAGLVPSISGVGYIRCHSTIGQHWNKDVRSGLSELGRESGEGWEKRRGEREKECAETRSR